MTPKELDDFLHNPTDGYFVKFSGFKTWWKKRTTQEQQAIQSNWYSVFKSYDAFWLWNAAEAIQRSGETPINIQESHRNALLAWVRDRIPAPRHPIMDVPEPTEDEKKERVLTWEETYKVLVKENKAIGDQKHREELESETKRKKTVKAALKSVPKEDIQKLKDAYGELKDKEDIAF